MLAIKRNLKESGEWIEGVSDKWNSKTRAWQEEAKVDFNGHEFEADAKFDGFRFPGNARFQSTKFMGTAQFDKTEFLGITWFSGAEFFSHAGFSEATIGPCAFRSAKFRKIADFWNSTFTDDKVNFVSVKFSSNAVFDQVKFKGKADFNQMEFKGDALFEGAEFSGRAIFWKAKFSGQTNFRDVTFSRLVIFDEATFSSNVLFDQCVFEKPAYFSNSSFKKNASFKATGGKSLFLYKVKFDSVPDFSGAHFEESPLFESVNLDPEHFRETPAQKSDINLPARWRALRRLAVQGHDHEHELQFFKGEIMARRGTQDKWTHSRFWVGWLYQVLSDFGSSMVRPLLWLIVSLVVFTLFYASQSETSFRQLFAESPICVPISGGSGAAALSLSIHNAVPFATGRPSGQLKQIYACLYSIQEEISPTQNRLPADFTPVIPHTVAFAGIIQFFVSAVLIFLFVLAVRNHFRIR